MATDRHGAVLLRRLPLLAALLCLCLVGVRATTASTTTATDARATAASATATHLGVAARTLPDRLAPAPLTKRFVPSTAALPAAVVTTVLLAAGVVRRNRIAGAPQFRLLAAAGRGPPLTS